MDTAMSTYEYDYEYLWMRLWLFMNKTTNSTVASSSTNSERWMSNAEWQTEIDDREMTNKAQKDPAASEFRWLGAWRFATQTRNCYADSKLLCGCGYSLAGRRRIAMKLRECNGRTVLWCGAECRWSRFTMAMQIYHGNAGLLRCREIVMVWYCDADAALR